MYWVRGIVGAFAVLNFGLGIFWVRFAWQALHSDEHLSVNVRGILLTRVVAYLSMGVFFGLTALYRSQWFAWIGISAMLAKLVAEAWFRRRERRDEDAAPRGASPSS